METERRDVPSPSMGDDESVLHRLGYAQELFRGMGGFRNFAISFTIISILAGCLTSYTIAFEHGGPIAVTWGWLLVGLMSTIIALSMAEIGKRLLKMQWDGIMLAALDLALGEKLLKLVAAGVDAIITNVPDVALAVVGNARN